MDKQTPIGKIRDYYEVSKYLNGTQKIELKNILGLTEDDENRISGFENETEFLIMIYLLGWIKNVTAIDESASPLTVDTVDTGDGSFCLYNLTSK